MRHLQTPWLQQAIPVWRWLAQEASKSIPTGSKYHALTKGNKNQLWRGLPCSWHCCAGRAKWLLWRQRRAAPFKGWKQMLREVLVKCTSVFKYTHVNFCQMLKQKELNSSWKQNKTELKQNSQSNNNKNSNNKNLHLFLIPGCWRWVYSENCKTSYLVTSTSASSSSKASLTPINLFYFLLQFKYNSVMDLYQRLYFSFLPSSFSISLLSNYANKVE